ncbi:MAG TPA: hypothetical protein DCQ41_05745 [Cryomorphaceae bacterium]|nr:hypothetical protein [Cryomorphaceae bacterium]
MPATMIEDRRTVNTVQLKKQVLRAFKLKRPLFVWGGPGIGKSNLIEQIVNSGDLGKACMFDMRLGLVEPTDIRGVPYYNKESGKMDWADPVDLPSEEVAKQYDTVVLFLDEFNQAVPAVQAASYQLVLNRRVGQYKLPDNVVVIAAGNRETDKGVSYRMPKPLENRFGHFELKCEFLPWLDWAVKVGTKRPAPIHPDVVGYLTVHKADLYKIDPTSSSRGFATPRTWEFVSDNLDGIEDTDFSDNDIIDMVSAYVGEGLALKFNTHMKMSAKMPNPTDIISGKVTEVSSDTDISAKYSLSTSIAYELKELLETTEKEGKEETFTKAMDNVLAFMMKNFETELVLASGRVMLNTYKLPVHPKKNKHAPEFFKRYGKLILGTDDE